MDARYKRLLQLLLGSLGVGFMLGLLIGLLVGGCSRRDKETRRPDEEMTKVAGERSGRSGKAKNVADTLVQHDVYYSTQRMSYAKTFSDLNENHLQVADSVGLESIPASREIVDTLSGLVEIKSNGLYELDELHYSVPYLTRGGAKELTNIGRAFRDSLENKELPVYKFVISSILRTENDVQRLRRSGNPNASERSAHCYGTTFDISYSRFVRDEETEECMNSYELTKVLAEVLRDERAAGRCLVKYERKEHCFHITSTLK